MEEGGNDGEGGSSERQVEREIRWVGGKGRDEKEGGGGGGEQGGVTKTHRSTSMESGEEGESMVCKMAPRQ
jgi:hypothetical protein